MLLQIKWLKSMQKKTYEDYIKELESLIENGYTVKCHG